MDSLRRNFLVAGALTQDANPSVLSVGTVILCTVVTLKLLYNVYFHPLRLYPGPWLARATPVYNVYYNIRGTCPFQTKKLHDQYGEVVRIAPNTLSYNSSNAWKDIYGSHVGGAETSSFPKDSDEYIQDQNEPDSILTADNENHRRLRKVLAHAFSDKALRSQESIIQGGVEQLISNLHKQALSSQKGVVDMTQWYNAAAFDLIGELTFGRSFGCLDSAGKLHPWIEMVFAGVKQECMVVALRRLFPRSFTYIIGGVMKIWLAPAHVDRVAFAAEQAKMRITERSERQDFMSYILKAYEADKSVTVEEIESFASILILAGSETTAALLSGATYYLCKNPLCLQKLVDEVRSNFDDTSEVTSLALQKLPYLQAVLEEALRIYTPVPATSSRVVPGKGAILCGRFVPGGSSVGVNQYAANISEAHFIEPTKFKPERWLATARFAEEGKDARQPFGVGPRYCPGKNLAYIEMRLILAKLLLNFDLDLQQESEAWDENQKVYALWEKKPLYVQLVSIH